LSELEFELTDVDLQDFFSRDNLNSLKSSFPKLKLVQRGHTIKAFGEKSELKLFNNKFRTLLNYYSDYNNIDPDVINDIVVNNIKFNGNKPSLILHGVSGKPILAKTVNQKKLHKSILNNDLIFAIGPAGTGKTYTGVAMAVKALKEKEIKKIILTRPAVEAGENLGYLPGDLKEKLDPYMQPLYDALLDMIPLNKLKKFLEDRTIEIAPLAFMRGRTLDNAFVILDEAQNTTNAQMKMFLTRMGMNAKFMVTGDPGQVDLPRKVNSGLKDAIKILSKTKHIDIIYLDDSDVIRHPIVKKVIDAYNKIENK
jgi:phosphate starvation-inducible PhoH-like protein|tara:strand:- start:977 stop:1909 length:933 start_codon:yes stop_codon:yes gene_type:complete